MKFVHSKLRFRENLVWIFIKYASIWQILDVSGQLLSRAKINEKCNIQIVLLENNSLDIFHQKLTIFQIFQVRLSRVEKGFYSTHFPFISSQGITSTPLYATEYL